MQLKQYLMFLAVECAQCMFHSNPVLPLLLYCPWNVASLLLSAATHSCTGCMLLWKHSSTASAFTCYCVLTDLYLCPYLLVQHQLIVEHHFNGTGVQNLNRAVPM